MEKAHLNNGQIFLQSIHHKMWILMQSNDQIKYSSVKIGNLIRMDGF